MTLIAMFPGPSSRYPDMLSKLDRMPVCDELLDEASDLLGRDLRTHYRGSNVFPTNRDVQVGVFLANHVHLSLLAERGIRFEHSLGLSLGEYNHLVHTGALTFADALRLVDIRGAMCDRGRAGVMVSVFPMQSLRIEATIARLGLSKLVCIGMYNSPRQTVISGETGAIDTLLAELEREEDYFDATVIEPKIPMHSPVFSETAEKFGQVLLDVHFGSAERYVPNVRGEIVEHADPMTIRECLKAHVEQPVRWQASVEAVAASVPNPCFVEVGPRAVLYNLFGKDWMPGRRAKSDAALDTFAHLEAVVRELRDAA
jgi:[acyl-carrier-protein] S-malonyltransferase